MSVWFAVDALFMTGKNVRQLGRKYAAFGPSALIAMMAAAKIQDQEGEFILSWVGLKDGAYLRSIKQAKDIVGDADTLDVIRVSQRDDHDFTACFPDWNVWQPARDRTAAERKRRQRARSDVTRDSHADVTDRADRDVTNAGATCHGSTGQDRTEHLPPRPPKGGRRRDRDAFELEVREYAAYLLPDHREPDRAQAVGMALGRLHSFQSFEATDITDEAVLSMLRQLHYLGEEAA